MKIPLADNLRDLTTFITPFGWKTMPFHGDGESTTKILKSTRTIYSTSQAVTEQKSSWYWGPNQEKSFQDTKLGLTKPTILLHYNPQAPTKVCADASSHGLGAVLLQEKEGQ